VFSTAIDLRGHVVEKHGDTMSTRDLREARRIPAEFAPSDQATNRGRPHKAIERRNEDSRPSDNQREFPAPFISSLSSDQTLAPDSLIIIPPENPASTSLSEVGLEQVQ